MGLDEIEFAVCSVPSEICLKLSNSSSFSKAEEQQITSNLSHKICLNTRCNFLLFLTHSFAGQAVW